MKSMTGYGAASARLRGSAGGQISVEIKSVNQRFLDLKLGLPREYAAWEAELRKQVQDAVSRGRIEVYVSRTSADRRKPRIEIDVELARDYVEEWRRVGKRLGVGGEVDLGFLRGLENLYRPAEPEVKAESEMPAVRRALAAALRQLDEARVREGANLARDMRERIVKLTVLAGSMVERANASLDETRRRIEEKMRELLGANLDESRLVQEAAFLAERSDVTEEIVRLKSHLAGLADLLASKEAIGKRIEFLLQEVQREVNTVASKSSDLALTHLAVDAKAEVEKIREQVQNVE